MSDQTSDPAAYLHAVDQLSRMVLVYSGPDHVVIGANRAAREGLGYRPELVLGRPLREAAPEFAGQYIFELMDRVYVSGEPFASPEFRVLVDDGQGTSREVFFDCSMVPLRGPDGRVTGMIGELVEVTEQVLARRALEAEHADFRERYEAAQDVVLTLQRSLLPPGLPVLPGFRIAARYLVADGEQGAGGDWFDAVPVNGALFAVVGDVVGHGAAASAVMGQLRTVLEEFLLDGDDLVAALARLDRFAARVPGARGATVCLVRLDPVDGSMSYACAGHPPPIVVGADGATRVLAQPGGAPLGDAGPAPVVTTDRLAPGEVLLCFTDGLVERPGVALQSSIEELAVVASDAFRRGIPALTAMDPAERIADLTVERMTRDGHLDDVTLLVVRVTGAQVADLVIEVPAEAAQLGVLREALGGWLAEIGAGQADMVSIELAVLEAATNSIEHAYREPGGTVRVEGVIDDRGRACLTVIDHGFWRPPAVDPGHRGRGLTMMRACMDSVEIDNSYYGSTVLLDRQLRRAARLAGSGLSTVSAGRSGAGRKPTTLTVGLDRSETPRLVLSGPVDVHTGDELRRVLWDASRGGALPLTIDLSQVTHLGSVGVQLLFEFAEQATADRRMPTLIAPRGCPAHYPIALTGLDHLVTVAGS